MLWGDADAATRLAARTVKVCPDVGGGAEPLESGGDRRGNASSSMGESARPAFQVAASDEVKKRSRKTSFVTSRPRALFTLC
jgi:hypothetical protein